MINRLMNRTRVYGSLLVVAIVFVMDADVTAQGRGGGRGAAPAPPAAPTPRWPDGKPILGSVPGQPVGGWGAGVTTTVSYTANDVLLTLTPKPLVPTLPPASPTLGIVAPRNARNVAISVDKAVENGGDPSSLFGIYNLPAAAIVLLVTVVLVVGIRESAGFNAGMVILKVAAVLFVIVVGVVRLILGGGIL